MDRSNRYCSDILVALIMALCAHHASAQQLTIITISLPPATQNATYSAGLHAVGGTMPYV